MNQGEKCENCKTISSRKDPKVCVDDPDDDKAALWICPDCFIDKFGLSS